MVYADYFCALCRIFNLYVSFLFLYFVSKLKNMGKKKEIQINDLTVDELKKLIGEVLNSYFGNMKSSSTEIIGIDEVCKITGLSKHTVYKKTSNKEIPFYKSTLRRRSVLRFRRSEIENWILRHSIGTVDEYLDAQDAL
jgi:excisionase family DNA binding protein